MPEEKPQNQPPTGGTSNTPNFNELEQGILKFWEDNNIFQKSLDQSLGKPPYIFYDGPPFATGLPHYGSILPSVIKDAIPRYQTMKGRYVRRRWGWDCHGLPIENIVEKNLNISGKKQIEEIGVDRFNKVCRENVLGFAAEWGKMVKRVGRWTEFDNSYKTMDTTYMESVWWALKQIWDKGLIYEDRKVLLYCSRCETPISNFEVAMDNSYRDVTEESIFAKFKMLPRQRIVNDLTNDKTYALAWTTTPWTLPGNTSLNVGADIKYVMVEQNGERYILAKDLLGILDGEYEMVAEFAARALEGLEYEPLYPGVIPSTRTNAEFNADQRGSEHQNFIGDPNRSHRIYLADFVTTEDGTGIVHNAAMYGEEDYELAKEKNLPRLDMLDHKGQYLERAPKNLRGMFFKDADKVILKELKERNLSYKTLNYTHSYPHCYRCGTPLFYNALPAWFINIQKIKPRLRQLNEQEMDWYPEYLKAGRFDKSVESAPDWNISRNRFWATALPFWKCQNKDCKNVFCIGSINELKERAINFHQVYPNYDANKIQELDLHKPYIDQVALKCPRCGGQSNRVPEVVDCWVESGSMPFAEMHYPFENEEMFKNRFPADFVSEYVGQVRAWYYVMLVMSALLFDKAPFKNLMTTGNILAEDGSKMSKSKQNYPDPNLLIEKYGADALRFYLLTCPVVGGDDINFSEKSVQEVSRKVNMLIYNMWSFFRMYEKSSVSCQLTADSGGHILDRWVMSRLSDTHQQVTKEMDAYNTVKAGRLIIDFVNDLSTWYVRRSRERIKKNDDDSKAALQTLGFVLSELAKMLAPFMPFLADFIYKDLTGKESVHLELWTKEPQSADPVVLDEMSVVREIVESGLSLRKENNLKVRQPLAELEYHLKGKNPLLSPELEQVLADELNVKLVSGRGDFVPKGGWAYRETPAFKLALNLELSAELKKEGLARELERAVQDLRKKSGLKVGELVDVYYNTADEGVEDALLNLFDRKKTFVSQIQKSLEVEADFEIQSQVEGKAVWLGMVKI
jgi:isoleucyl-tRNA synthetase